MPLKACIITDTETGGLDPKTAPCLEVGVVLYDLERHAIVECFSTLMRAETNEAIAINGIAIDVLAVAPPPDCGWRRVAEMAERAMAIGGACFVAHRAEFDQGFYREDVARLMPWVCSKFDVQWPRAPLGASLTETALAHGLGLSHAHRALTDCLTLARLFERCHELGHDVAAMLERGLRPKATFQALVSYDDREKAKAQNFTWKPETKQWLRRMAIEDAKELPFSTRQVGP